jgi:diketogulonate reductase-like aldo/keto reductase
MLRGHVVIPKSNSIDRIKENIESMNFKLTLEEVDRISSINEGHRICDNYAWLFKNSIFA